MLADSDTDDKKMQFELQHLQPPPPPLHGTLKKAGGRRGGEAKTAVVASSKAASTNGSAAAMMIASTTKPTAPATPATATKRPLSPTAASLSSCSSGGAGVGGRVLACGTAAAAAAAAPSSAPSFLYAPPLSLEEYDRRAQSSYKKFRGDAELAHGVDCLGRRREPVRREPRHVPNVYRNVPQPQQLAVDLAAAAASSDPRQDRRLRCHPRGHSRRSHSADPAGVLRPRLPQPPVEGRPHGIHGHPSPPPPPPLVLRGRRGATTAPAAAGALPASDPPPADPRRRLLFRPDDGGFRRDRAPALRAGGEGRSDGNPAARRLWLDDDLLSPRSSSPPPIATTAHLKDHEGDSSPIPGANGGNDGAFDDSGAQPIQSDDEDQGGAGFFFDDDDGAPAAAAPVLGGSLDLLDRDFDAFPPRPDGFAASLARATAAAAASPAGRALGGTAAAAIRCAGFLLWWIALAAAAHGFVDRVLLADGSGWRPAPTSQGAGSTAGMARSAVAVQPAWMRTCQKNDFCSASPPGRPSSSTCANLSVVTSHPLSPFLTASFDDYGPLPRSSIAQEPERARTGEDTAAAAASVAHTHELGASGATKDPAQSVPAPALAATWTAPSATCWGWPALPGSEWWRAARYGECVCSYTAATEEPDGSDDVGDYYYDDATSSMAGVGGGEAAGEWHGETAQAAAAN